MTQNKDKVTKAFKRDVERLIREDRALLLRLAHDAVERLNDPTDAVISPAELRRRLERKGRVRNALKVVNRHHGKTLRNLGK